MSLRKCLEFVLIVFVGSIIGFCGMIFLATQCHASTVFDQVLFHQESRLDVPTYKISRACEPFCNFNMVDSKLVFNYSGYNCGIHETGANIGVIIWLMFNDVNFNPPFEANYAIIMYPTFSEDGQIEVSMNDEYFEQVFTLTDSWKLTIVFEPLIDEWDHPFPKNPGFEKISISVVVDGDYISTSNEDASFGYVKMLYR